MTRYRLKLIGISLFALILIIIGLQNTAPVSTRILFFTVVMPRVILLLIMALLGFAIGVLYSLQFVHKNERKKGNRKM
ncbi:MAG: LapA family protein [Deltaproteobacteria bacterium]|jgi:uncharacterized integral membrane protein